MFLMTGEQEIEKEPQSTKVDVGIIFDETDKHIVGPRFRRIKRSMAPVTEWDGCFLFSFLLKFK